MASELPEARDADVIGAVAVVVDVQAARGEAPNNQLQDINLFLAASICQWTVAKKTSSCTSIFPKNSGGCI